MKEHAIEIGAPAYPDGLAHIPDPPGVLYARGALAERIVAGEVPPPAVAIVGARDATAYGLAVARELGHELAARGIAVVSGLALGVDGAAHRGALEAGGTTVAVVGSGTDVVYPRAHGRLRGEILATGAVVGELAAGTPPMQHHFPRRNRLISGMSLGVVVVEATLRSGSLSTARHALEQGREVFAVPGPVNAPRSRGPHALLKAGARLVEGVDDILQELPRDLVEAWIDRSGLQHFSARCVEILARLQDGPSTGDELAAAMSCQISEIWTELLDLELRGAIARGAGGRFARAPAIPHTGSADGGGRVD
jgi:DNA processing protein